MSQIPMRVAGPAHREHNEKTRDRIPGHSALTGPDEPDDDDDDDDDDGDEIVIPKKELERLLEKHGRSIWEKLKEKLGAKTGNIWQDPDRNYRVDSGCNVSKRPGVKKNGTFRSTKKRSRLQLRDCYIHARGGGPHHGSHKRLFEGSFNTENPPDYKTWKESILNRFAE